MVLIHFSCVCDRVCSAVSDFATPWTTAHQAPLSMGVFKPGEIWTDGHRAVNKGFKEGCVSMVEPSKTTKKNI